MNQLSSQMHSLAIKQKAKELGFDFCGIAKAQFLEDEAPRLEKWLNQNQHGHMYYMANHFDKRLDPRKLVDGAQSIISVLANYFPDKDLALSSSETYKVSKYAYGIDYHIVIKERLKKLLLFIEDKIGKVNARIFVDSGPVMDKAWASRSGLGWIGKNSNLITKSYGSFFFIGEIILDVVLDYDHAIADYCGTCTRCIDACPTNAIHEPYVVDGSKCISYFTIELKEDIPIDVKGKFNNWVFGCDICQDVCPWNRFSRPTSFQEFQPIPELTTMTNQEWEELTQEVFDQLFKKSPLKRARLEGLRRTIRFIKS